MKRLKLFLLLVGMVFVSAVPALSQNSIIDAENVKSRMEGKHKVVVIDARPKEEYLASHIPGAISIPAEKITEEKARLPKNKKTPLIFYCRGMS